MPTKVNFGTVQSLSDDQLRQKTVAILQHIHLSGSATSGVHSQIVAEQLLIECKDRKMLLDVQDEFESICDTELEVGSVLPE